MKKISDLFVSDIKVGLRLRSLASPDLLGTIVDIDHDKFEIYFWIKWDNADSVFSGFYNNDCECEVVE